ncbi:membrane protein [Streptomyces griseoaurantiacus M045]|uniref:Membrane protein n=1 Tax=Streptomyces griseoaurantiacus M045 TaxID=996637 RepID=F3NHS9_9ACTN|nr:YkvA family protein [Streptomyces griseoaurantiacus]EGG46969.1 membrane protein [Streptomyces griseoaurantiacus M045]
MDSSTWTLIVVVALVCAAVLGAAVVLLLRLVRTRRELRRAGLPTGPRWVFWGAVAYLVLPTDLLPDPVYLDDIGVLLLALRSMSAPLRAARLTGRLPGRAKGRASADGAPLGPPDASV